MYTTNHQMELRAAIEGLRSLASPSRVRIYSHSAYLINPFKERWLNGWDKNGWRTAGKKPVKNVDLWKELLEVASPHKVEWIKVEGHAGVGANERCHRLVQLAIDKIA
jgi:ribonuclease HI